MANAFMTDAVAAMVRRACGDRDPDAMIAVSLMVQDDVRASQGVLVSKGGLSVSDAGNIAYRMVAACHRCALPPPRELVDLIQMLLHQDRPPLAGVPVGKIATVNEHLASNPNAGTRALARLVEVDAATIRRWEKAGLVRRK